MEDRRRGVNNTLLCPRMPSYYSLLSIFYTLTSVPAFIDPIPISTFSSHIPAPLHSFLRGTIVHSTFRTAP